MSQLLQKAITAQRVYSYNGTDMYATMVPWTPSGALFSYGADVVVDSIGSQQRVISGATTTGDHALIVTGAGSVAATYRDTAGTSRSGIGAAIPVGVIQTILVTYYVDRVEIRQDGVLTETENFAPELASLSAFAASLTPDFYFNGTISNIQFTSQSPMQNINAMGGNGTNRYASIPEITFAGDYRISQWVRSDLSGTTRLFGNDDNLSTPRAFISSSGEISFVASPTISAPIGSVVADQDHFIEFERIGTNATIYVDGIEVATTAIASASSYTINAIHNQNSNYSKGIITHQVLKDLDTGITRTYNNVNDPEVIGADVVVNGDFATDSDWSKEAGTAIAGGQFTTDGTVTGELGRQIIPEIVTGKTYDIIIDIEVTQASLGIKLGGGSPTLFNTSGVYTFSVSDATVSNVQLWAGSTAIGAFNSISVKQATLPLVDSTGGQDGVWVNAVEADRVYLPKTDRLYRGDDAVGNMLANAFDTKRMKYHLNGVDQYFSIPEEVLEIGSSVSWKAVTPLVADAAGEVMIGGGSSMFVAINSAGNIAYDASTLTNLRVDGVFQAASQPAPLDGLEHTFEIDVYVATAISRIGANRLNSQPCSFPIYDIDINGERFYPVNDGKGGTVEPELLVAPTTVGNPWVDNGDGTYSIDGSQGGTANLAYTAMLSGVAVGKVYKCVANVTDYVAGELRIGSGSDFTLATSTGNGLNTLYLTKTDTNSNFNWQAPVGFEGTIEPISVKEYVPNTTIVDTLNPETELVVNGDFANGTTGWGTGGTAAVLTASNNVMTVDGTGATNVLAQQAIGGTLGKTYQVSIDFNVVTGSGRVDLDGVDGSSDGGGNVTGGPISATGWNTYVFEGVYDTATLKIDVFGLGSDSIVETRNISVIEYTDGTIVNGDDANWINSSPTDATIQNFNQESWVPLYGASYTDGTTAPALVKNGIPYDADSSLAVDSAGAIHHYHQGLPFTAEGRLAVATTGAPTRFGSGSAPFNAANRLVVSAEAVDHYSASMGYSADSAVVI